MERNDISSENVCVNNETNGTTQRSPLRSISMDGQVGYLYKTPYSWLRQHSINDSREYNELKDMKDKADVNSKSQLEIHTSASNKPTARASYVTQISKISTTDELLMKEAPNTDFKLKMHDEDVVTDIEQSKDYDQLNKRRWRNGTCQCAMSGFSCALSVITLGLVMFAFTKISENATGTRQEIVTHMGHSSGIPTSDISAAGNFKIDQTYLHEYKKIKWMKDENSEIIPSVSDDCLTVPYDGKYLAVSRFTFNILPEDNATILTHFFKLKTSVGQLKDGGYKRKYVSVLENKLRTSSELNTNQEFRKPSVFIEFFDLDAHDQICPNVSNPGLLYESRMDNDVNIIKI